MKDLIDTQEPDEKRKIVTDYKDFFQNKYEDSMKADSTKADVRLILNNFPPIKSLNAKYFRGLMKTLSPYTLWKRYGIAKRALEYYGIEHDLDDVEMPRIDRKSSSVTVEDLYTADELLRMFHAAKNPRDRAILEILYESGCRQGEILSMTCEGVTFGDGPADYKITVRGKTGVRVIPMGKSLRALDAWRNIHPTGKGPLWTTMQGDVSPLTKSHLYSIVKTVLKDAGITGKKRIVHMFRHTRITEFVKLGILGMTLAKLVGWKDATVMQPVYVHLSTHDVENEVADKIYGKKVEVQKGQMLDYLNCMSCGMKGVDMGAAFCPKCGFPLTAEGIKEAESAHKRDIAILRDEVKILRKFVDYIVESAEGKPAEEVYAEMKDES